VAIAVEMHAAALTIAQRHGYGIYDAMIVAAALGAKCSTLYSEDLQDGQVIDELDDSKPVPDLRINFPRFN
jgi:predicted nucleic acid-binding protein